MQLCDAARQLMPASHTGAIDQLGGYKDSIVGAVTGDKTKQAAGNARNEAGAAKKDANAPA